MYSNSHDSISGRSNINRYTSTYKVMGHHCPFRGCPRIVMVKALNCAIVVSEFDAQSHHYLNFRTNTLVEKYESSYPSSCGLDITTTIVLEEWLHSIK